MSTEKENVAVNAQTAAKRTRRGVNNQTKAVSQLKFHEKDAANNCLFVGHLAGVSVDWSTNADGKIFTGLSVPRLTFHFASNHNNVNEQRHVYQTLNPVESSVLTIPGGSEEWKVNNIFNWIKHILDVFYLKGRELTADEEAALTLPFEDFDENDQYVAIDPEEVIAGYRFIFENTAAMLNGQFNLADGEVAKPCFKTIDGKILPCWIKLLRAKKVKGTWREVGQNGDLAFDSFIGNGVVELVKKDVPPMVLRVDLAKESITPKETNKTPTVGIPGMNAGMGGIMADGPIMDGGFNNNPSAFNAASEGMPF